MQKTNFATVSKSILSLLFLLLTTTAFAQKGTKVDLISSESSGLVKGSNGKMIFKFKRGVFKQDQSTLTADSSFFYNDKNIVEGFGNVVINQGDTLHIFADKLHYDGNTKLAVLTDNVKMVDKDAVLTTNFLTYNTATKVGTYTGGGKLVNKENILVSKNGYYFAGSRDAYFRYNVVFTTPDAIIKTDTLRYNSGTRTSYFYGPTYINGTKDKDVLYTENGRYETTTEQAFFGKKNLYTQGSKTLKGDSLFYDRIKGYGRAVKNVVFNDNEQKTTVKGGLGEYYKAIEKAIITVHPYVIFVTEDSTKNGAKSLAANRKLQDRDSLTSKTDIIGKKPTLQKVVDSLVKSSTVKAVTPPAVKKMTLRSATDSLIKNLPAAAKAKTSDTVSKKTETNSAKLKTAADKPTITKADSMYLGADTIETSTITYKQLKEMQAARWLAQNPDTTVKKLKLIVYTKATLPKVLSAPFAKLPRDTSYIRLGRLAPDKPPVAKLQIVKQPVVKPAIKAAVPVKRNLPDSLKKLTKADSLRLKIKPALTDTSKVRIIFGYHNAKLFKSDLQAKADSMFYSSSDSTIRCFVNPIIWTQGSQLSGDTIALQMKNRKLDNIDLFPSGFIVNIEKADSIHFNQAAGRRIHGTFKDNKLNTMEITGNAETIYYNRDTVKNVVTELARSQSNSSKAIFKNGRLGRGSNYVATENRLLPLKALKEEDKILKGFLWKPKERPQSKEDITIGVKTTAAIKSPPGKNAAQSKSNGKTGNDRSSTPKSPGDKSPNPVIENTPQKAAPVEVIISNY